MPAKVLAAVAALLVATVPAIQAGPDSAKASDQAKPGPGAITLTHAKAVELAIQNNPDIQLARQQIERTQGVVIEVRAEALPRVGAVGDYQQLDRSLFEPRGQETNGSGFDVGQLSSVLADAAKTSVPGQPIILVVPVATQQRNQIVDKNWNIRMEVRQLLYSGGQVRAALNIAKFTEDSSYYLLRDTIDRVIANVRTQFYLVLLNRSLIKVQEESLRLVEQQLKDQQDRYQAGTVARFNVLRAEVEVANVKPDLIRARNDYRISQWRLARLIGIDFDKDKPETSPINVVADWKVPPEPAPLKDLVQVARQERALLKVRGSEIESAREQIRVAQSGYYPRLEAAGGYEVRNSAVSPDLEDSVDGWYVGVNGSWNVFDGLATYGRVKQARAEFTSAQITYEDAQRQVELEVQEAYSRVQEAKELLASQVKNVESANEALRLANERLSAGAGTQLDVLDARTALTQAQTTELRARFDYYSALAELDRATGVDTTYLAVPGTNVLRKTGADLARQPSPVPTPTRKWWQPKPKPSPTPAKR